MRKIEVPLHEDIIGKYCTNMKLTDSNQEAIAAVAFSNGIAYANEQLAKTVETDQPAKWQPTPGMRCAFWDKVNVSYCCFDVFQETEYEYHLDSTSSHWDHCAALDSIDEIGLPPSYFINRDERHV